MFVDIIVMSSIALFLTSATFPRP